MYVLLVLHVAFFLRNFLSMDASVWIGFVQLIKSTDEIVSIYYRRLEHGYPTPSLDRDKCVAPLDAKTILRRAPPLI